MASTLYTPGGWKRLSTRMTEATDAMKYMLNLTKDMEDANLVTPKMLEAIENCKGSCEDFIRGCNYYLEAKHWECENIEEVLKKDAERRKKK